MEDRTTEAYEVFKKSLKESLTWNTLVSTIENDAIKILENKGIIHMDKKESRQHPEIIGLINKLISEYMDWMGYKSTNTMFMKESGSKIETNDRQKICSLLDVEDNSKTLNLPLLTVLITMFKTKSSSIDDLDNSSIVP